MDNIIGCWVLLSIKKDNGHPGYFQVIFKKNKNKCVCLSLDPFCGRYCWLACPALNLKFFYLFDSNYRNWKSKILAFPATLVLRVALWLIRTKETSSGVSPYLVDCDQKRMNQTTVITSLSHWIHATSHLSSNLLPNKIISHLFKPLMIGFIHSRG